MDFLSNLQLDQNQLLNVVLHKASSPPTSPAPVSGQLYYDTTLNDLFYYDGTAWVDFSGDITSIIAGQGITGGTTNGAATVGINVDNATIEIVGNQVRLRAANGTAGILSSHINSNAVTEIKIVDKAISFQKIQDVATMTVIGRVAAGSGVTSQIAILNEANMASNSATALATQQSIKAYVDSSISSIGTLVGSYVPTGTTFPGSGVNDKGDYWYVTGSGTVQGITMNTGDLVIANVASGTTTNPNHYIFLESNRDQATTTMLGLVYLSTNAEALAGTGTTQSISPANLKYVLDNRPATTAQIGLIELADQTEVNNGSDTTRAVTPATLKSLLDSRVGGYAINVGDGTNSTFVITHNLNTLDVDISLIEIATGKVCYTDSVAATVNSVSLSFARIPTLNKYRVIIKK